MPLALRPLGPGDAEAVLALYRAAAAAGSGLARYPDEIDLGRAERIVAHRPPDGLSIGAFRDGALVGEIHAARPGPRKFAHVLGDLTVAVHPLHQGEGIGRALFEALFAEAARFDPPITRIELFVHEGNPAAQRLYERLGFVAEGRMPGRLVLDDGQCFADIPMARLQPQARQTP